MEFKYRAGEFQHSPSGSHSSSGVGFSSGHAWRESDVTENPNLDQEAFLREIEKQRIREGIIATEVARRMMLEDEVRRELMVERQMGLRHARDGLPYEEKLPTWFGLARKNSLSLSRNVVELLFPLHGSSEVPPTEVKPDYYKDKHIMLGGDSRFEGQQRIRYTRDQLLQFRECFLFIPLAEPHDDILRVKKESWGSAESNAPGQPHNHFSQPDDRDWRGRSVQLTTTVEEGSWVNIIENRGSSARSDCRQHEGNQVSYQDLLSSQFERAQVSSVQGGGNSRFDGWQGIRSTQDQLLQLREAVEPHGEVLRVKEESLGHAESNTPSQRQSHFSQSDGRGWHDHSAQWTITKEERSWVNIKENRGSIAWSDFRPQERNQVTCQDQLSSQFERAQVSSVQGAVEPHDEILRVERESLGHAESNCKLDLYLSGAKEKSSLISATDAGDGAYREVCQKKKPEKEWTCALCQISTTSEGGLNEHLRGKKHKDREASLAQNSERGNDSLQVHHEQTDPNNGVGPKTMKKMEKTKGSRMNSKFWCEICQVGAPSNVVMESHKKGKKHKAHFKY